MDEGLKHATFSISSTESSWHVCVKFDLFLNGLAVGSMGL